MCFVLLFLHCMAQVIWQQKWLFCTYFYHLIFMEFYCIFKCIRCDFLAWARFHLLFCSIKIRIWQSSIMRHSLGIHEYSKRYIRTMTGNDDKFFTFRTTSGREEGSSVQERNEEAEEEGESSERFIVNCLLRDNEQSGRSELSMKLITFCRLLVHHQRHLSLFSLSY